MQLYIALHHGHSMSRDAKATKIKVIHRSASSLQFATDLCELL